MNNILKFNIFFVLISIVFFNCSNGKSKKANHLEGATSPYLLQHLYNPVDWYPWGEEALKKAQAENKMLLISIGYAACHWCHVMEEESFSDTAVANYMNRHFVCIKVDREERPDIDNLYMAACQVAGEGKCGWPLNVLALPDGKPFWIGTYLPKNSWMDMLTNTIELRKEEPGQLILFATKLAQGIRDSDRLVPPSAQDTVFSKEILDKFVNRMLQELDQEWGGFQGSPKFPLPGHLEFLQEYAHVSGNEKVLKTVDNTLTRIACGGIYDHLRGGVARYATDEKWRIPHFEKMLYDNAQLVSLYSNSWRRDGKYVQYRDIASSTLLFIREELSAPQGGIYSSLDADSEGKEGQYYTWGYDEIKNVIQDDSIFSVFSRFYKITKEGNWENGKNILWSERPEKENNRESERLSIARQKLRDAQNTRIKPAVDDKIITAWNALMIKGYCDAYCTFNETAYLDAALLHAEFIRNKMMQPDGKLFRNFREGKAGINAFLDDYAFTIEAFISLYQVTFEEKWLYEAKKLVEYTIKHFSDTQSGLFYYTSDEDPELVVRKIEIADQVMPSSNSVMARNLFILGEFFYEKPYQQRARTMLSQVLPLMRQENAGTKSFSNWARLLLWQVYPPNEVVIAGPGSLDLRKSLMMEFLPGALVMGSMGNSTLPLLKDKNAGNSTLIYVCEHGVCYKPVETVEAALEQLTH